MRTTINAAAIALFAFTGAAATRYAGGDISLLPEYENAGAKYKDNAGKPIADLLPWCAEQGMNAMRVRLFVNPADYKGSDKDPNACQDLAYITPLCKRIVDSGMDLMLDFHYSDFWADPAKQYTPAAWKDLTDEQLYQKIYDYTKETLEYLKGEGIVPAFVQPGNEISYGMLWGPEGTPENEKKKALMGSEKNWARFGTLLKQAIKAIKEVCPEAKIVIHTERVSNVSVQKNFYDQMKKQGVEYDIIGLSYYPYFHGGMNVLKSALNSLETNYPDKDIMIVETGYSYKWEVPGSNFDNTKTWPYTEAGQNKFMQDLVAECEAHPKVNGIFWWWMEYNAYGTNLSGWYNAPLFDSTTGKATEALKTLCSFAEGGAGVDQIGSDATGAGKWYTIEGIGVDRPERPGIYIRDGKKIAIGK